MIKQAGDGSHDGSQTDFGNENVIWVYVGCVHTIRKTKKCAAEIKTSTFCQSTFFSAHELPVTVTYTVQRAVNSG